MGTPEWAPVQTELSGQDVAATDAELNKPQNLMDPDDPALTSEVLDVNLDGNAYAFPPPPPDGKYRAKLKHLKVKNGAGTEVDWFPTRWGQEQQAVAVTGIEISVLDASGKYDGVKAYDRNVATFVSKRDKSSKIQTILKLLKKPDGSPWLTPGTALSAKGWMDLFLKALAGEPEIGIVSQWTWNCQGCGEEVKAAKKAGKDAEYPRDTRGMNKFPIDADATRKSGGKTIYSAEMQCQKDKGHGYSRARFDVAEFIPLSEVGK